MPGQSFDHVAEIYDQSRGGTARGDHLADAIAPWLIGPRVVELGIGTGVIAAGLRRHGHTVTGVDLSDAMMRAALERLGPVVARADADVLPFATGALDTVVLVWVLQLVDDPTATMREAARVVRRGGRMVVIAADADHHPDDELGEILRGLRPLMRPGRSGDSIAASAPKALELEHRGFTPWDRFDGSAAEQIDLIERRMYSSLFDVDDATWDAVVEPVLRRLRGLPDVAAPRRRTNRHPLIVWRRGGR